ncbi:hypothetical protein FNF27_00075 [Cafeteria roenbergensis]|uniref:Uncharacterized protein n=1 Tax=Cafeteria roenbergensis TaxID=33653 RepID=A0A5A8ER16_CAFRO|nr:hypothetical protein FNF27_00075 [Cafeteria roenbergensis]
MADRRQVEAEVEASLREEFQDAVRTWEERLQEEAGRREAALAEARELHGALDALHSAVSGGTALDAGVALVKAQSASEASDRHRAAAEAAKARAEAAEQRIALAERERDEHASRARVAEAALEAARDEVKALQAERDALKGDVERARAAAKAAASAWLEGHEDSPPPADGSSASVISVSDSDAEQQDGVARGPSSLQALEAACGSSAGLPAAALRADRAASKRSGGALSPADVRRWTYYYGVRSWAAASPEGRVALAMLDETAGADGAAFAVFCARELRAGDGDHAPAHWGPHSSECDVENLPAFVEAVVDEAGLEAGAQRPDEEAYRRSRRAAEPDDSLMLAVHQVAAIGEQPDAQSGEDAANDADMAGPDDAEARALWGASGLVAFAGWKSEGDWGEDDQQVTKPHAATTAVAAAAVVQPAQSSASTPGSGNGAAPRAVRRGRVNVEAVVFQEDDSDEEDAFVAPAAALQAAAAMVAAAASLRRGRSVSEGDAARPGRRLVRSQRKRPGGRPGLGVSALQRELRAWWW